MFSNWRFTGAGKPAASKEIIDQLLHRENEFQTRGG